MKWKVSEKLKSKGQKVKVDEIISVLLKNRGLITKKQKDEFFSPKHPNKLSLREVDIKTPEVKKAINRIKKAKKNKEKVIVYGDYDADGICATAILWETLYALGVDVLPHIPDRFTEGYGINPTSIENLKSKYPNLSLIITVDNGIVAHRAVNRANKLKIDVIVTDHHQVSKKKLNTKFIIHTTSISGAGVSWIFAREIRKHLKLTPSRLKNGDGLDLAAIGTIGDIMPLIGSSRSFASHGLSALAATSRLGLNEIITQARISKADIGSYHAGFMIAPRINAMGRLDHGIESLRLLCTTDQKKAESLARKVGKTNFQRQKTVERVVEHAQSTASKTDWDGVIVLAHESYHEGVIGLAASRIVELFYRPAIVISQGEKLSKASARSVSGFNIIEAIRSVEDLLEEAGGHPMAAGFTIKTTSITPFTKKLNKVSIPLLTDKILTKTLSIDMEINFDSLTETLAKKLTKFEPTGYGNTTPRFVSCDVEVLESKTVGKEARHLKMVLRQKEKVFDTIAFGMGDRIKDVLPGNKIDVVYALEENEWNGVKNLQLRVKDVE